MRRVIFVSNGFTGLILMGLAMNDWMKTGVVALAASTPHPNLPSGFDWSKQIK